MRLEELVHCPVLCESNSIWVVNVDDDAAEHGIEFPALEGRGSGLELSGNSGYATAVSPTYSYCG